jgi:hypothetical protein
VELIPWDDKNQAAWKKETVNWRKKKRQKTLSILQHCKTKDLLVAHKILQIGS